MKRQLHPVSTLLGLAIGICLTAEAQLNVLRETVVDPSALNFSSSSASFSQNINGRTFQRDPLTSFKGYQYTAFFDSGRRVCVGRRSLPDGAWEVIRFSDYSIVSNDSHNVVTVGVCHLDGTIHLAFDHHADPLNYRVSSHGAATAPEAVVWSESLFSPVTDQLGSLGSIGSVTYPAFFNAPNGNLFLYYRSGGSGNGDGVIQEYDGSIHDWSPGLGKFISRNGSYSGAISTNSTSRNPYLNGISYSGNRLHVSWGWRESAGGSQFNHDISYAYSDDDGRTWMNSAGSEIGSVGSSPIRIDASGLLVADIPQGIGLSNDYTHYAYPDGGCHVMVTHDEAGTQNRRYHHYWRNAAGVWNSEVLPFSGSRPKLLGDDDRTLFLAHASGGRGKIAKGVPNADRSAWTWSVIHTRMTATEGGEGLVDSSRWESERVLSYYGQEGPDAAGSPNILSVVDYHVSAKAILPTPENGMVGVPETTSLEWSPGIDAVTHRVYLGTDPEAVRTATPASPEFMGEQAGSSFIPESTLQSGTTYYWRVDEVDSNSSLHQGLLWSFSTPGNFPPDIQPIDDLSIPLGQPIPALDLVVDDDLTPAGSLQLVATSSNVELVADSGLQFSGSGQSRILEIQPEPGRAGSTVITVTVDDGGLQTSQSFTLTITDPVVRLYSTAADASVRQTPNVVDVASPTTLVGTGGTSPRVDRSTVFVFQLPDLGSISDPFTGAAFQFHFAAKQGSLYPTDLYGIGRRQSPDVLPSDYYGGTAIPDPGASLLEASILTNSTSFGTVAASGVGELALRDFLNVQYGAGAGAGQFVFLRLNTADYRDGINRATITMSEGAEALPIDTRPQISLVVPIETEKQRWRLQFFGSLLNEGDGADTADPDGDGEDNAYEFATAQDPLLGTTMRPELVHAGSKLEFLYQRNANALDDGAIFVVEWSDTLLGDSWSNVGVTERVDSEVGPAQAVVASIPSVGIPKRFVRLRIVYP